MAVSANADRSGGSEQEINLQKVQTAESQVHSKWIAGWNSNTERKNPV
jgi:hypothetical protein